MTISEYDAFGPWIYEIDDEHPVPRLFADYLPPKETALLQLKLPRNIERRDAKPGMDLYDFAISASETELTVLERQDTEVKQSTVNYPDIKGIRIERDFLLGTLFIYTDNDTFTLPFNGVSIDEILRLTKIIRDRYLPADVPDASELEDAASLTKFEHADTLFYHLIKDMQEAGESILCGAYQTTVPLQYTGTSSMMKKKTRQNEPKLEGTTHLITKNEIIVIERAEMIDKDKKKAYGYQYSYLPLSELNGVEIIPRTNYKGISALALISNKDRIMFHYSSDNEDIINFYNKLQAFLEKK